MAATHSHTGRYRRRRVSGRPPDSSGGQDLRLLLLELLGRDDAPVAQVGELGQLVGRIRTCDLLDVAAGCLVLLLRRLYAVLVHLAAPDDQVDQDPDERNDQHEQEPQRFAPAGQVRAAEDVDEDGDQDPEPDNPKEDLEDRPEGTEQRIGVGTSERHVISVNGKGAYQAPRFAKLLRRAWTYPGVLRGAAV